MSDHTRDETVQLPGRVAAALRKFLSECRTGNVTLNIKDGQILGAHVNEIITIKPADKPATTNGEQRRKTCPTQI